MKDNDRKKIAEGLSIFKEAPEWNKFRRDLFLFGEARVPDGFKGKESVKKKG